MPEFNAVYKSGDAIPRVTSAAVTGGQVLVVSGANTVAPSSTPSSAVIGVAAFDAASGDTVTVMSDGVYKLGASGSISAGNAVTGATAGAVAAHSGTNYSTIIGVALDDSADSKVLVKLRIS